MNVNVDGIEFDGVHRFDEGKLTLRTQSQGDKAGLLKLCPHDQSVPCRARWSEDGACLVIEKEEPVAPPAFANETGEATPSPDERARLMAMNDADLETYAAERNVTWDAKASKQTIVGRILKAVAKK